MGFREIMLVGPTGNREICFETTVVVQTRIDGASPPILLVGM